MSRLLFEMIAKIRSERLNDAIGGLRSTTRLAFQIRPIAGAW